MSQCFEGLNPPPGQKVRYFEDEIFRCIFINEKFCISTKIPLKFVPRGPIDNIGFDNGLAPNRRQAINWTNTNPIHWRIYAALGRDVTYLPLVSYIFVAKLGHYWFR